MNNFYIKIRQYQWFRLLTIALVGIVTSLSAAADTIDLGELQLDTEYSVSSFKSYVGHFTAPKSGTVNYTDADFSVYTDADFNNSVPRTEGPRIGAQQSYTFTATAGTTYWFYAGFTWNDGSLKISMDETLKLLSTSIDEGEKLAAGGRGAIEYQFSQAVAVDKVTFSAGKTSAVLTTADETYRLSGSVIIVEYGATLLEWFNKGLVKAGDELTVKFEGLRASADASLKYNSDGNASFKYVAANKPITLVSATTGDGTKKLSVGQEAESEFLSYFREGDPNGKYVFTFSEPLNPNKGFYQLQYGNSEADDLYTEDVTGTFSDNNKVLTIDVTGKLRDYKEMVPSKSKYSQIVLAIHNLTAADGQLVYTGLSGSEGSFDFVFKYTYLTNTATAEFTPNDKLSESIEIYVSNYSEISYDGVSFSWSKNGVAKSVVVDKSDLSITTDSFGGAAIVVTVPSEVRAQNNVTVTLSNLTFSDGQDHSESFVNVYNVVNYTVDDNFTYTYSPNLDAAVSSCDQVVIDFSGYDNVSYREGTAIMSGRTTTDISSLAAATQGANGSQMIQPVTGAIDNDHYTITFPEGYFELANNVVNPEFAVTFIIYNEKIATEKTVETTPANGSVVESCTEIVLTFSDSKEVSLGGGKASIAKEGGETQYLPDATWGEESNQMIQSLNNLATDDGTYTVTFPAGYFNLDDDTSDEITITFTVTASTSGISEIANGEGQVEYFNLNGVQVVSPAKGIYIVRRGNSATKQVIK